MKSDLDKTLVKDAMHRGVVTCERDTPVDAVAGLMAGEHIHSVVVIDGGEAWGIVSDIDLLQASSDDADALTAGEVAATEIVTVRPDEPLEIAARLMREHDVTHVIVVDPRVGLVLGVVSTLDVAATLAAV